MDRLIEVIVDKHYPDAEEPRRVALVIAEEIVSSIRARRLQRHERDAVKVPARWRYEDGLKRVKGEFKEQFSFWLYKRELNVFSLWAEELGLVHMGPVSAVQAIMREVGSGRLALVRFEEEEEYLSVLKFLDYVKSTFRTVRRPLADSAAALIRALARLRRVQYIATRPCPIAMLTEDADLQQED